MGQCGKFWSGVLHLGPAWLLPPDKEEQRRRSAAAPAGGEDLCAAAAAASDAKDSASFGRTSFIFDADWKPQNSWI